MSQMPEMPATGWAEQDYDRSAYPEQAQGQPAQSAAVWQQDTEPDWGASQQGYPENEYPQEYPGQEHQGQAYPVQAYPNQAYPEQGYPQQPYQGQAYPAYPAPAPAPEVGEGSGLPTEFDHLFRDSTPDSRRAIDRQKPMVGGAEAGYLAGAQSAAAQQSAAAAPEAAAMQDQSAVAPQGAPYQPYQQPFPQQGEQYAEQFPAPAPGAYQGAGFEGGGQYPGQYPGAQFQNGGYPQADYQQGAGYAEPGAAFNGGSGGGSTGGRLRGRRNLIIGGVVVLAAVIGVVIATSNGSSGPKNSASGGGTPSATPSKASPKQQADLIYQLIQQSGQLRSDANTAVVDVNGCKDLATAQNMLSSTAQKRQAQADSVGKLDVSGIQNGAQLVSQLKAAWTASAQYDNAYAQIAGDVQHDCKSAHVQNDSNQQTVQQATTAANTAKAQAAQLWNDNVATPLDESQVSSDKL